MKKEALQQITTPISQKDFENLKRAFDYEEIERTDLTDDVLDAMDKMWAKDNEAIYEEKLADGTFGAYD